MRADFTNYLAPGRRRVSRVSPGLVPNEFLILQVTTVQESNVLKLSFHHPRYNVYLIV